MSDLSYEELNKKIVDDSSPIWLSGEVKINIPKPVMHIVIANDTHWPLYKKPNFFHRKMMSLVFGWKFIK